MKKSLLILLALFAFTSCSKEEVEPVNKCDTLYQEMTDVSNKYHTLYNQLLECDTTVKNSRCYVARLRQEDQLESYKTRLDQIKIELKDQGCN